MLVCAAWSCVALGAAALAPVYFPHATRHLVVSGYLAASPRGDRRVASSVHWHVLEGRPPSRQGQTCREAGTQSHGSGLEPDSRTTEGGCPVAPGNIGGSPRKETTMPGTNARYAVTCVGLGLLLCGILLVTAPGTAG